MSDADDFVRALTRDPTTNIHRDGMPWWRARKHPWWRRHRWQSAGLVDGVVVQRCSCGAFRRGLERTWIRP